MSRDVWSVPFGERWIVSDPRDALVGWRYAQVGHVRDRAQPA